MKSVVKMVIFALICGLVFTSCSSDKGTSGIENEGTFSGTYTVTYLSSDPNSSGKITIKLENQKFTCLCLHEQAEFSGNYIINDDKIIFEMNVWKTDYIDKNGNIICYDFDTYIIPQGECNYTFDRNKLKLSKVYENFGHYEWNLEKK